MSIHKNMKKTMLIMALAGFCFFHGSRNVNASGLEDEKKAAALSDYLLPAASDNEGITSESQGRVLVNSVAKATASGKNVVILDPGHGGSSGASRVYNGVRYYEDVLALEIANACKEKLEKSKEVTVYLTRNTNVNVSFADRTNLAKNKGAAVLVSFHLNSTGTNSTTATGAEAICQNNNYNALVGGMSRQLAQIMVNKLAGLGLKNRGVYYKNSSGTKYPDGSVADNFAINRNSKLIGIPGIIVEHCFINNEADFNNYLATPDKTAKLGEADADGILQYLKLEQGKEPLSIPTGITPSAMTDLRVKVKFSYTGATKPAGYELYRATVKDGSYIKVATGSATAKYMVDKTGVPGTTYYYKVRAVGTTSASNFSDIVSYAVLNIPEFQSGTYDDNGNLTVKWKSVSGATGYQIARADSPNGTYTVLDKDAGVSYTDKNVLGKCYYYKVRAFSKLTDRTAYSIYSEPKIQGAQLTKVTRETEKKVKLTWKEMEGVSGYRIYRKKSSGSYVLLQDVKAGTTSYEDTKADISAEYTYKLCSYVSSSGKEYESFGETMKLSQGIAQPTISDISVNEKGAVTVNWGKVEGAQGYRVLRLNSARDTISSSKVLKSVSNSVLKYTDSTAKSGKNYIYAIQAYKTVDGKKIYSFVENMKLSGTTVKMVLSYSNSKAKVVWNKVENIDGYKIYKSTSSTTGFSLVKTIGKTTTSYNVSGLTTGKTYYFKVLTYKKEQGKDAEVTLTSKVKKGQSGKAVAGPTIKKVSRNSKGHVTLTYKKISGVKGYYVYRSQSEQGTYTRIGKTTKLSYTDTTAKSSKNYYYKVRAYYLKDGVYGYSGFSTCISSSGKVSVKLDKPTIVSAIATEDGGNQVLWKKVDKATGYEIWRSETGQASDFKKAGSVSGQATTSYVDTKATENRVYYYRIKAFAKAGSSTNYSEVSNIVINGVKSIVLQARSSKTMRISWSDVAGATEYQIYGKRPESSEYVLLGSVAPGTGSFDDGNLTESETYSYAVRISDGVYTSAFCPEKNISLIGKVTGLKANYLGNGVGVNLNWNKVSDATYYAIYRKTSTESDYTKLLSVSGDTLNYTDSTAVEGVNYSYKVRALKYVEKVVQYGSYSSAVSVANTLTPVMGTSEATKEQMIAYYNKSGKMFPAFYADAQYGGITTIEDFVQIIIEEATMEGVRADLLACQIYKETGYLQYGGDVKIEQCNFGGIGAVGGGAAGATFPDVRTGIRAQVQHLKAYGDENAVLQNACVDPRYAYVTKGCAKYIEWLGIKENPNGKGWATATNYGYSIVSMMNTMKNL